MIRIGSDTDIEMNWNSSDWLGMNSYPILLLGILYCILLYFKTSRKVFRSIYSKLKLSKQIYKLCKSLCL